MTYHDNDFHFYNSENDGYREGFGGYSDAQPGQGGPSGPELSGRRRGTAKRTAALLLACAVVGGGAGVGGAALYGKVAGPAPSVIYQSGRPTSAVTMANTNNGQPMTPEQLYAANVDSCVGITVSTTTNVFGYATTSAASGSGFVITKDGYIITNYHVIEDAVNSDSVPINVAFHDGSSYVARLVGGEKDNDVAVLKIEADGLTAVTLGNSEDLKVGQTVMAIGNPLGELTYSLTDGLISALDRLITTGAENDAPTLNMLQTNCAINPGNSGGPLFNSYGEVIGITTAKYGSSAANSTSIEGLGFAIPINDVKDIVSDLIQHGYVTGKPYMGVHISTVSQTDAQRYSLSTGAYVESVAAGSAAEKAGMKVGDIIIAVDDTKVDSSSAMTAAVTAYRAGDTAKFTAVREGKTIQLSVTFDEENEATIAANKAQEEQLQQQQQQQAQQYYGQWPFGNLFP